MKKYRRNEEVEYRANGEKVTRGGSSMVRTVRVQVIISVENDGVSWSALNRDAPCVLCAVAVRHFLSVRERRV